MYVENSVSLKVERELEKSIRDSTYQVGQKLPTEFEIGEMFSVSRTVVREALKSLKARGLINIKKGSGVYVSEFSTQSALDPINLYFELSQNKDIVTHALKCRQLFEPELAAQAALNRTEEDLEKFKQNLNELVECAPQDIKTETELDIAFHNLVTRATGNHVVSLIMEPILHLISKSKPIVFGKHESLDRNEIKQSVVKFHSRIYRAIADGDSREAYYQMKEHLFTTERNVLEAKSEQKED